MATGARMQLSYTFFPIYISELFLIYFTAISCRFLGYFQRWAGPLAGGLW